MLRIARRNVKNIVLQHELATSSCERTASASSRLFDGTEGASSWLRSRLRLFRVADGSVMAAPGWESESREPRSFHAFESDAWACDEGFDRLLVGRPISERGGQRSRTRVEWRHGTRWRHGGTADALERVTNSRSVVSWRPISEREGRHSRTRVECRWKLWRHGELRAACELASST